MKNFILQKTAHGKSRWLLLRLHFSPEDIAEYKPFSDFVHWMERRKGYSPNTVDQYAGHVARFIDFVYEASQVATEPEFSYVLDLYEEFLTFGLDSNTPEVIALAKSLDKTNKTTYASISQGIEASIKLFLEYKVTVSGESDANDIFTKYYRDTYLRTGREIANIKKNSWLEGTVRDSLKRSHSKGNINIFT